MAGLEASTPRASFAGGAPQKSGKVVLGLICVRRGRRNFADRIERQCIQSSRRRHRFNTRGPLLLALVPIDRCESHRFDRRLCESRAALGATPQHENHARCCVWGVLCGSDLKFRCLVGRFQPQTQGRWSFAFLGKF